MDGFKIVSDQIVKYGKLGVAQINQIASQYPIPALVIGNLMFIAVARKIASVVSYLLNQLTCGYISRRAIAPPLAVSLIVAGNCAVYQYMALNLSLHVSLLIPMVTFACVIVLYHQLKG